MAESGNPVPQAASEANYLRFREDVPADEPAVSLDSSAGTSSRKRK